jgi:HlyD family secretion protein
MPAASLTSFVRAHRLLTAGALVVAVAAGWGAARLLAPAEVDLVTAARHDLVKTIVASGHVETPHRVSVGATGVGTVRRVAVEEGDAVTPGQVLVTLDDTEARAAAAQADAAVAQAEAKLRQMDEVQEPVAAQALKQAEVTLAHARSQLARDQALVAQGFLSPASLDDSRKAVDLAASQRDAARRQLTSAGTGGSDRTMSRTALDAMRDAAAAARVRLTDRTVVAPFAGTVIARSVEPGDVVQAGRTLLTLSPSIGAQLVVSLDEKHLGLLAVGQAAQASADAFPDRRFPARIGQISPAVDATRGAVEVKLDVPDAPAYLRQDMTVSVDIAVATRRDALSVPAEAVHDADGAAPWVLRLNAGRLERRAVKTGLRGGGVIEIVDGLQPGDALVAGGGAALHVGQRVVARAPTAAGTTAMATALPDAAASSPAQATAPASAGTPAAR